MPARAYHWSPDTMAPKKATTPADIVDLLVTKDHNAAVVVKTNVRVRAIIQNRKVHEDPVNIPPDELGVSEYNRDGEVYS